MIPSCLKICLRPAFPLASLLAFASLALTGCFGVGKKGEASLVVSTVDPAIAANAGRVDMSIDERAPDYSVAGLQEQAERALDQALDLDVEPEPEASYEPEETPVRTEITPATAEYVVRRGDTLGLISRKFDLSLAALKRANGMSDDKIIAGQTLRIPGGASEEDAPSEVVATPPTPVEEAAEAEMPETLPSGVVPPDPPRRPSLNVDAEEAPAPAGEPVKAPETTIGDDGFLRFSDE